MKLYNIALILALLVTTTMVNEPGKEILQYENNNNLNNVIELQELVENVVEEDAEVQSEKVEEVIVVEEIIKVDEIVDEPIIEIVKFDINRLELKEGILSDEVTRIKSFLKRKGYLNVTEGAYFDSNTKEQVINYQENNGLVADGIIGMNTFTKINEDMELNKISIPKIDVTFSKIMPLGYWIIINKSNNTLYHLKDSEIVKSYPVATGKTIYHTPEGKFTIVTKLINPAWGGAGLYDSIIGGAPNNPLGKRWLGLSINGGGSYGIHGNADYGSIGKYVSLGCIRMFNHDIEVFFDLVEKNPIVWIGSEDRLNEYGVNFQ